MSARLLGRALLGLAGVLVVAALAWPAVALLYACASQGAPEGGWAVGGRLWALLGKTVLMGGGATLLCMVISIPPAVAVARMAGRRAGTPAPLLSATLILGSLLCPPMVFVFGWGHWWPVAPSDPQGDSTILSALRGPIARCILIWALWAWPIPAVVLATAWRRGGRSAYRAALLDAGPWRAFVATAAPTLRGPLVFVAIVLLMLFVGEYSVPHAGGLTVFATELLGRAEGSARAIDTAVPAMPLVGVIAVLLVAAWTAFRRVPDEDDAEVEAPTGDSRPSWLVLILGWWAASWALPMIALVDRLPSWARAGDALVEYGGAMATSIGLSATAGIAAAVVAIGLVGRRAIWSALAVIAILFGALPGALIGDAVRAAYLHVPIVYDHWPVIVIGYVGRFAWVAVLIVWPVRRIMSSAQVEQARLDGATGADVLARLVLPLSAPRLICAAAIVTALSLGDAATPALIQVPGVPLVSRIIIEKFHRLEDGMLVSLSVSTVAVAMASAMVVMLMIRFRGTDERRV